MEAFQAGGSWVVQVFIIIFIALLLAFAQRIILNRIHRGLEKTKNPWDDALIDALRRPLHLLIWVLGITFAVEIIKEETQAAIFSAVTPIRDVGVIFCVTWFFIRLVKKVQDNLFDAQKESEQKMDQSTANAITKLLRLSIIITASLVALQTLGFSISGVLAFGGIGGIAIGFAAKDLLSNFFGGLMLYLDRPFKAGDWIRSPDREIEGVVEDIGWRLTRIRTFDKRPLYLPNSIFSTIAVENPSRMSNRRIYETIGIRYDDADKMEVIVKDVNAMLVQHPAIDENMTLMVNFVSFAPSSLDFFVYTFTHTTVWVEFHEIKQDVMLKIVDIITAHGAEFAFPTSTLHVPDEISITNSLNEHSK